MKAILTVIAFFTLVSSGLAQIHVGVPPVETWGASGKYNQKLHFDNGPYSFDGLLTFSTKNRRVYISWTETTQGREWRQVIPSFFWPTEVVALQDKHSFCAFGKGRGPAGETKIRKWELSAPYLLYEGPVGGGAGTYTPQDAPITQVTTLWTGANVGQDMVVNASVLRGKTASLLVQFYDSREVYELDYQSLPGSLQIVASPTDLGSGVVFEPHLGSELYRLMARDHMLHGFVYIFSTSGSSNNVAVLIDWNRDGVLDSSLELDDSGWSANQFHLQANYLD